MYILHSIKLSIQAVTENQYNEWPVTSTLKPQKPLHHQESTICQNCHTHYKEYNICIHDMSQLSFNVTMSKHIHLVIKYINSHLNHIPVEPLNVPMK